MVVHLILEIFLSHCTDFCFNSFCVCLIAWGKQAVGSPGLWPEPLALVCPGHRAGKGTLERAAGGKGKGESAELGAQSSLQRASAG